MPLESPPQIHRRERRYRPVFLLSFSALVRVSHSSTHAKSLPVWHWASKYSYDVVSTGADVVGRI